MNRCVHYGPPQSRGPRCQAEATHQLYQADGQPNPGGRYCEQHAKEIIEEYARVLGEQWTVKALKEGE